VGDTASCPSRLHGLDKGAVARGDTRTRHHTLYLLAALSESNRRTTEDIWPELADCKRKLKEWFCQ
jgi:hypothetical protein